MSTSDNALSNGLGGAAGFGENVLGRNDDSSTGFIDVSSIFESGLNFFGTVYYGFYINNNGNITFNSPSSTYTPFALTGSTGTPIIAPFFTDIDTRAGTVTPSPGGNSTGSNLVYWDLDPASDTVTITWDDVGEYSSGTTPNAFQLSLHDTGGGNFTIELRYESIQWNHSNARAGYSAADGRNYFELPESGTSTMLALETASNVEQPGVFLFAVRNGVPNRAPTNITLSTSSVDENCANGTVVGTLTTTDADVLDSHIYSLVDDAGGRFAINGNQLVVAAGALLDYETNTSHNITIRTTDAGGFSYSQAFTLNLNNLHEPDLKLTATTAPTTASVGETLAVSFQVSNQGDAAIVGSGYGSEVWSDAVYLSDDATLDATDTEVAYQQASSQLPLAAGDSYTFATNITIPSTATTGSKYLLLVTDSSNTQWEDKETNNIQALPIQLKVPDLVISTATAPTTAILNQSFAVAWSVTNQGDIQAPADWYDYIYLSDDTTLDDSDTYLTQYWTGTQTPLAVQSDYTCTQNITISDSNQLGSRYLLIVADRHNYQKESDETNNIQAVSIELTAPDLVVADVSAATTATWGETVGITWSVTNQGTGAAPTNWSDYFYLSADPTLDGSDIYLGSQTATAQTPLLVNGNYTWTRNITVPNVTPGSWYLLVKADGSTQQMETNEANNVTSVLLQVQAPDLVVSDATVTATGILGETTAVTWTVTNQGTGETLADWYDYVYLSDNNTLDDSDILLGYKSAADGQTSLAAFSSYTQTLNLTLTDTTTTGNKYLLFVTDRDNQQPEVNESNNVLAQSFTITAADLQVEELVLPTSAAFGSSVALSWTVRNAGDGTATKGWRDRLWLSKDNTLSSDDVLLLTEPAATLFPLAAEDEYTQAASVTLPLDASLFNGSYYFLAQTDALGDQPEANETNNIIVSGPVALTLPLLPDLVVSSVAAPIEASGQQIEIAWTVTNQGNGDATGTWTDNVYLSNDATVGGDQLFGAFSFTGTITAGGSVVRKQLDDITQRFEWNSLGDCPD